MRPYGDALAGDCDARHKMFEWRADFDLARAWTLRFTERAGPAALVIIHGTLLSKECRINPRLDSDNGIDTQRRVLLRSS